MNCRVFAVAVCGIVIALGGWPGAVVHRAAVAEEAAASAEQAAGASDSNPFADGLIWKLHLQLSADEYQAMQPPAGGGFPGGPPQRPAPKRKPERASERNLFGVEFPWVEAELTADGKAYPKVGLRYAGDAGYFAAARGLKRPLRIEFERFGRNDFHGLKAINLHAAALDATKAREKLASALSARQACLRRARRSLKSR